MLGKVKVVSVEDAGYYSGTYTSGSTVKVTLERDGDFATCDGILIWEEEFAEEAFDEWVALAIDGEEGYTAMLAEDGVVTMYGA